MSKIELNELKELIARCKEVLPEIKQINDGLMKIRMETRIDEYINFNSRIADIGLLNYAIKEIQDTIDLEEQITNIENVKTNEYSIGEYIKMSQPVRTRKISIATFEISPKGTSFFDVGNTFLIIDSDGYNYKILSTKSDIIVLINQEQLDLFFKKTDMMCDEALNKVELTFNGVYDIFMKDRLDLVRFFIDPAREKEKRNSIFGYNYTHRTSIIHLNIDEVFGTFLTIYFKGEIPKDQYKSIIVDFGDKFIVGFSQSKHNPNLYKYDGKISHFTKEEGKHGTHYFPKDVFDTTQKDRIITLIEKINLYTPQTQE